MKKLFWGALLLIGFLGVSCSDSDDEGPVAYKQLIGTWDCYLETYTYDDGEVDEYSYEQGESYVVFTSDELTMYDDEDVMSGRAVECSVKGDKLYIAGMQWCQIEKLSDRDMVWLFGSGWTDDGVQRSYFRKR